MVGQHGIVLPHGLRLLPWAWARFRNLVTLATSMPTGQGAQWPQYMQWPTQLILGRAAKAAA